MFIDVVIFFKVCYFGFIFIQVKVWFYVSDLDVGLDKRRMEIKSLYVLVLQNKIDKIIQFIVYVYEMLLIMDSKCYGMFYSNCYVILFQQSLDFFGLQGQSFL